MRLYTADAIKEQVHKLLCKDCEETDVCPVCDYRELINEILDASTIDAEPVKQERCEFCKDGKTFLGAVLVLGNDGNWHSIRYCPNCGAKMDESTMGQEKPSDKEFTLYADEKPIVTFKDSKIVLHGERKEDAETNWC